MVAPRAPPPLAAVERLADSKNADAMLRGGFACCVHTRKAVFVARWLLQLALHTAAALNNPAHAERQKGAAWTWCEVQYA